MRTTFSAILLLLSAARRHRLQRLSDEVGSMEAGIVMRMAVDKAGQNWLDRSPERYQ